MHIFLSTRLGALGRCGPYLIHLSKTINETVALLGTSSLPQKSYSINMCVLIIIMYKYFICGICLDFPWHLVTPTTCKGDFTEISHYLYFTSHRLQNRQHFMICHHHSFFLFLWKEQKSPSSHSANTQSEYDKNSLNLCFKTLLNFLFKNVLFTL